MGSANLRSLTPCLQYCSVMYSYCDVVFVCMDCEQCKIMPLKHCPGKGMTL